MQGGALSFQTMEKKIQLTQHCEKAFFQHLVIARNCCKIRPNAHDGWGTVTPLCQDYSGSRSYPKTKALSAIPEGTIIGPVSKVHVVKILDRYGIEAASQSSANPEYTTYIVISREEERFVITNKSSSPATKLLASLHESGRNEERKVTRSHEETWAAPRSKETSANPVILTQ